MKGSIYRAAKNLRVNTNIRELFLFLKIKLFITLKPYKPLTDYHKRILTMRLPLNFVIIFLYFWIAKEEMYMHRDGYEPIKVLPDHYARLQDNICIFIFSARSVFKTQILSNSIFFRLTLKIFLSVYS